MSEGIVQKGEFREPRDVMFVSVDEFGEGKNRVLSKNGKLFSSINGSSKENTIMVEVMPDIERVDVVAQEDGNPKVIMVKFTDDTMQKAVLDKDDVFSIEYGISVCITKKLISGYFKGQETAIYNKLIKNGVKAHKRTIERDKKLIEELNEKRRRRNRLIEKKRLKREKQEKKMREYLIGLGTDICKQLIEVMKTPQSKE